MDLRTASPSAAADARRVPRYAGGAVPPAPPPHPQAAAPARDDAGAAGACAPRPDEERAAFLAWVSRLVHEHRAPLARLARAEGLSPEDAFDAVQEAFQRFITLPQGRAVLFAPEDSRNLLVVLTRNVARNRRRLHALARPHTAEGEILGGIADDGPSAEALVAEAEERVRLISCVRRLGHVQRAVVTLRMLDEVPGDDVARTLGLRPGHVAVLLHRAKANLLACMGGAPADAEA